MAIPMIAHTSLHVYEGARFRVSPLEAGSERLMLRVDGRDATATVLISREMLGELRDTISAFLAANVIPLPARAETPEAPLPVA